MCIPARAARAIDADLTRYPLVVKENKRLRRSVNTYEVALTRADRAAAAKDTAIAATERQLGNEKVLRKSDIRQGEVWKKKAKGRFWIIVGETLAIVAGVLLAAR